ncbi:MAG TPA: disulfide bond formation protein B [Acidimicrobiia bacterium]|nr:disulfide bond formation protein B [Acidimicrobiia bacterium]
MSVDTVSTFLAVGALVLLALVTAVWVVRLVALVSTRARRVYDSIRLSVEGEGVRLAWAMAVIAMAGSLYYSEVAGYPPCEYCWYQRIAMYPLVVILGVAMLRRDRGVHRYVLPLAIPGGLISLYHYGVERFPDLQVGECNTLIPCSVVWVWKFDLVSIAFMAFVCFSVIVTVLLLDRGPAAASAGGDGVDRPLESKEATP